MVHVKSCHGDIAYRRRTPRCIQRYTYTVYHVEKRRLEGCAEQNRSVLAAACWQRRAEKWLADQKTLEVQDDGRRMMAQMRKPKLADRPDSSVEVTLPLHASNLFFWNFRSSILCDTPNPGAMFLGSHCVVCVMAHRASGLKVLQSFREGPVGMEEEVKAAAHRM